MACAVFSSSGGLKERQKELFKKKIKIKNQKIKQNRWAAGRESGLKVTNLLENMLSLLFCTWGKLCLLLFRFLSFIRNWLFMWFISITVSLTILGVKSLGISRRLIHWMFHVDIFSLTDISNISVATNRDNVPVIPWDNNLQSWTECPVCSCCHDS